MQSITRAVQNRLVFGTFVAQWCVARGWLLAACCAYTLRPITLAPGQSHLVAQASTNLPSQHHQCRIAIGDIPPQVTPSFITRAEIAVATGGAIAIRTKNQGQDLGLDDHKKFEGFAETTIATIDSADVTESYGKHGAIGSIPCS